MLSTFQDLFLKPFTQRDFISRFLSENLLTLRHWLVLGLTYSWVQEIYFIIRHWFQPGGFEPGQFQNKGDLTPALSFLSETLRILLYWLNLLPMMILHLTAVSLIFYWACRLFRVKPSFKNILALSLWLGIPYRVLSTYFSTASNAPNQFIASLLQSTPENNVVTALFVLPLLTGTIIEIIYFIFISLNLAKMTEIPKSKAVAICITSSLAFYILAQPLLARAAIILWQLNPNAVR